MSVVVHQTCSGERSRRRRTSGSHALTTTRQAPSSLRCDESRSATASVRGPKVSDERTRVVRGAVNRCVFSPARQKGTLHPMPVKLVEVVVAGDPIKIPQYLHLASDQRHWGYVAAGHGHKVRRSRQTRGSFRRPCGGCSDMATAKRAAVGLRPTKCRAAVVQRTAARMRRTAAVRQATAQMRRAAAVQRTTARMPRAAGDRSDARRRNYATGGRSDHSAAKVDGRSTHTCANVDLQHGPRSGAPPG